jgi:hypothetical protein
MTKKNEMTRNKLQTAGQKRQKNLSESNNSNRLLKIMMIAVCATPLLCLLYFYLLGWNLYHDKPLSLVYGLVMGIGGLITLAVGTYLVYRYRVQKHAKRAVKFDFLLLTSWVLLIGTFFSYLSSAIYQPGFSDIVTFAAIVMIAPLAVIVLPKSSKIGSLVFGAVALIALTIEGTMLSSMIEAKGDDIWTVSLPIFLGLLSNAFAAVILLHRFYTALQAGKS